MENLAFQEAVRPYKKCIRESVSRVGENADAFLRYLAWVTRVHAIPVGSAKHSPKLGERVVIWTESDGLGGIEHVASILRRAERIKEPVHLFISGGSESFSTRGNLPAQRMADALRFSYGSEFAFDSMVTVDGFSRNTGHQGRIIPSWLKAVQATEVVVVAPLYHIGRFMTTIGYGCKMAGIHLAFFPMPFGTWDTWHGCKEPYCCQVLEEYGSVRGFTYAELCFAADLPRRRFEDVGAENTSEIEKIITGWARPHTRLCADLNPKEALKYFGI